MDEEMVRRWAKATLQGELRNRRLRYADLADRLNAYGFDETEPSVRNKILRGTFSAAFFAGALRCLGVEHLAIDIDKFAKKLDESPTLDGRNMAEITWRRSSATELHFSHRPPKSTFVEELLPNQKFGSDKLSSRPIACGNCGTILIRGWSVRDLAASLEGEASVGRCSACRVYLDLPGSSVRLE